MDPYVQLATQAISAYSLSHTVIKPPQDTPTEMLNKKAGIFVSLHTKSTHELRGCIGTSEPTKKNIAQEIIQNAIAAGFDDPRFSQLTEKEIYDIEIHVDVLSNMEEVDNTVLRDPKRYGLLVKNQKGKSGLLLPDIGVSSVQEQIAICCEKGGIDPANDQLEYFRFTVTRHT